MGRERFVACRDPSFAPRTFEKHGQCQGMALELTLILHCGEWVARKPCRVREIARKPFAIGRRVRRDVQS